VGSRITISRLVAMSDAVNSWTKECVASPYETDDYEGKSWCVVDMGSPASPSCWREVDKNHKDLIQYYLYGKEFSANPLER